MDDIRPSNNQIYKELIKKVAEEFLPRRTPLTELQYGPLEINCFSTCFWMNVSDGEGQSGVYVKIPKIILYNKKNEQIMPLSDNDRRLGEDEYRSLVHLSRYWPSDDGDVRFVKPLGFLKDYNAIITERVYAEHFFKLLRRCDQRRTFLQKSDSAHLVMSRLGRALSKFHQTSLKECKWDVESIVRKMASCCSQLASFGVESAFVDMIVSRLETLQNLSIRTHCTNTLKGFDVRQVFIDGNGVIFLLDPGKMKTDYIEMDLARFIVTCRILYWGSMQFFLRKSPDSSYEESFLRSYYGDSVRQDKVICLLTIKELLKHWRMAYTVLRAKRWPRVVKEFLRRTYVDPFYKWQINTELADLGS